MPKAKVKGKQYIVLNPRGIPKGRHIIRSGRALFYEGDVIDAGQVGDAAALVRRGFLRPVDGEGRDG